MEFGPCAGVDGRGTCEVPGLGRCVFLAEPAVPWPEPVVPHASAPRLGLVAHLAAPALSADGMRRSAGVLAGSVDAVLSGDSPSSRVQFPPSYRAQLLLAEGVPVLAGLNCRDRNRVALEGEIAALADLRASGLVGVHCVTGDHTARGHRPDAMPVFDLDATRLTASAAAAGLVVSVAVAPGAPPGVHERAARFAVKVAAGAALGLMDDTSAECAWQFLVAMADLGVSVPLMVSVPVLTSVAAVHGYAGAHLPHDLGARIEAARHPRLEGLAAAEQTARGLLELPGITGVHLSPGVASGRELEAMDDVAEVARRLR